MAAIEIRQSLAPFMALVLNTHPTHPILQRLHVELRPVLKEVREANPGYQMTCVGHSLGAGGMSPRLYEAFWAALAVRNL